MDFDVYFGNSTLAVGAQSTLGDDVLILRGGSVLRLNVAFNKAFAQIAAGVAATTIATQDVWVQVTGLTPGTVTPMFTFASDQFTYVGPTQVVPASITFNASIVGAAANGYEIGIFLNGSLLENGIRSYSDGTNHVSLSCSVLAALTAADVIDVRIRNRTGTDDVTVTDAQLVISQ